MAEYAGPIDDKEGLVEYAEFRGLRNNVDPEAFAPGDLATALNVDIDDSLGISRRKGFSAPVTSAIDRDRWASGPICLGVGSNALKLVNPDWTTKTLRSGLSSGQTLSYAVVGDRVFYANGTELGCVQNGADRTWGITPPGGFDIADTGGVLAAGKYQVVVTYLRDDGQESGASRAIEIELTALGGISLSDIPVSTDPTVTHKVIYVTSVGGETLFRAGIIENAITAFVIREARMGVSPLLTQFLSPPVPGAFICRFLGWLLVAKGNRLYPSEPYAPEVFDLRKSIPFTDKILMLAPLVNGVWIGTGDQILWMEGDAPEKWVFHEKVSYGVIPGTFTYVDGELLGDGSDTGEQVAFFASNRGLCAGLPGGRLISMTQARYSYGVQPKGASIIRRHRGMAQMITTLQGAEVVGNIA